MAATLAMSAGCGSGRSEKAFCDAMAKHRAEYEKRMNGANEALESNDESAQLAGAAGGVAAIFDLGPMFDELAEVAPEEIRADAEKVRDAFAEQASGEGATLQNPMGGVLQGMAAGLRAAGSMTRLNEYGDQKCHMRMI